MSRQNFVVLVAIDFRKAYDLVNRDLLMDVLSRIGCDDDSLNWFRSYLSNRSQSVSQNGRTSKDTVNNYGVPQGSKLGPLLFAIFAMAICKLKLKGRIVQYADDLSLIYEGKIAEELQDTINKDMTSMRECANMYRLVVNAEKSQWIVFSRKLTTLDIVIKYGSAILPRVSVIKLLGVKFGERYDFSEHISDVASKIKRRVNMLSRLRHSLPLDSSNTLFKSTINPLFNYCSQLWSFTSQNLLKRLITLQKQAARIITFSDYRSASLPLFEQLRWIPVTTQWKLSNSAFIWKCINSLGSDMLMPNFRIATHSRSTRQSSQLLLHIDKCRTNYRHNTIFQKVISDLNRLPMEVRFCPSYSTFISHAKVYFSS